MPIVHTPFSADSAQFFLPYLTSATWWDITIRDLERLFALDQGFKPSVFAKQKALIRGQGHNIVDILAQSRIHPTSPIDMVRKPMIMIHEDAEVGPRQTVKHRIETFTRKACFTDC